MSYEDKILDKFADMIMPPGTIIAYQGIEAPEGFIVYDHIKIYEDEFPRLYPVLAANPNFKKGTDGDGRKWVELPEIEDLCIQMTTDTSQVGKTLEAQLPNIQGSAINFVITGNDAQINASGALRNDFSIGGDSVFPTNTEISDTSNADAFKFDASMASSIFSGSKLQPSALQLLPCIRC